jgi:hypothetical protein
MFVLILIALLGLGILTNAGIAYLEAKGLDKGYRGILVVPVAGLALAAMLFVFDPVTVGKFAAALGAIGLPNVAGDIWRSMHRQAGDRRKAGDVLWELVIRLEGIAQALIEAAQERAEQRQEADEAE